MTRREEGRIYNIDRNEWEGGRMGERRKGRGMEQGREGGREGAKEGGREGAKEGGRVTHAELHSSSTTSETNVSWATSSSGVAYGLSLPPL